ncbi:MAG: Membrane-bound lytic murein transglycosylase B precursor [Alphaproteobacteria bacterium ADurb.BinA280]|nr:lytic murein transglycosylase B [Xanthomonadales bacterium]MCC6505370.1 lytic murein transglycosylase B [Aquimonas sp.]OPZ08883.1 MAG: Membrane-bound lytic murein transglycosylase B precursor [Alphaproteobacteria bacterium ADurb.BinA280]
MRKRLMAISLLLPLPCWAAPALRDDAREAFVAEAVAAHALDAAEVTAWLGKARYQQSIIDAITRPAEGKPWKAYRPIFMNTARIDGGKAFLRDHWTALSAVEQRTGVPVELIVAIIGVETNYGRITGSYRVLDALYTLGLFYPPREAFFRAELATLFKLAQEEQIDLDSVKGSYAGAMGWGQFMPSSYRAYAVDGDGDGRRDLWNSQHDIFASIANYFVAHGWRAGEPVAIPANKDALLEEFVPTSLEAKFGLAALGEKGYRPQHAVGHDIPATVLNLEGDSGREYWIVFNNFYVISRYNRSPLYSLAVYQLSQQLAQARPSAMASKAP